MNNNIQNRRAIIIAVLCGLVAIGGCGKIEEQHGEHLGNYEVTKMNTICTEKQDVMIDNTIVTSSEMITEEPATTNETTTEETTTEETTVEITTTETTTGTVDFWFADSDDEGYIPTPNITTTCETVTVGTTVTTEPVITTTEQTTKAVTTEPTTTVSQTETSLTDTTKKEESTNSSIKNGIDPSKYGINASDKSIKINESVMKGDFGLESLYEKYSDFAIAWRLESLDTGKYLEYNNGKQKSFSSCCTIKAVFALYVCEQLESGKTGDTLDTKLYYDRTNPFHAHGGSGNIQKYGSGEFSIRRLLTECITVSDNDAYCVLLDHFGIDNFNKWLSNMGSSSWVSTYNVMGFATTESRALEWNKIVEYCEESNSEESELLWEILLEANSSPIRDALRKYTNLKYTVAHKSGWYNGKYSGTSNDCAIVTLNDGRKYLMIILTERRGNTYDNNLVEGLATNLSRMFESVD